ncbi:hypothetical protein Patl1_19182 [Pistacia atlantica]|uniref:Uncharacterized protein n=1 Tax=Pistacia atlantica TaxID=434234 RepID=A0ACC1C2G8_9ROSI|nr:hypothetical protein Patl1_19182 [Pistacia atlantica]
MDVSLDVQDVANKEKYFKGNEEALPAILEAILQRRLTGKHNETDDELVEGTADEATGRYQGQRKMVKDEYFNMDEKKWDEMISKRFSMGI